MRAYIQKGSLSDPITANARDAAHGFLLRGYEVIEYEATELRSGSLDAILLEEKEDVVFFGGVGTVREAVRRAGRPDPVALDLPQCLARFVGRELRTTTLGEVRSRISGSEPVHVKPLHDHKIFTGRVFREFKDLIPSAHVPPETAVLVQGVVDFVSEWRAYVLRGKVLNVGHYTGDPLLFPEAGRVQEGLDTFLREGTNVPIAFSMDWGIVRDGRTLLVECNDAFSLGNYSLRCLDYTAMILARWRELMGLHQID